MQVATKPEIEVEREDWRERLEWRVGLADETPALLKRDPIFRLLRDYRRTWRRWTALLDAHSAAEDVVIAAQRGSNVVFYPDGRRLVDPDQLRAAEKAEKKADARAEPLCHAVCRLEERIAATAPRTIAGVHASVEMLIAMRDGDPTVDKDETEWLRTIERALRRLAGSKPTA